MASRPKPYIPPAAEGVVARRGDRQNQGVAAGPDVAAQKRLSGGEVAGVALADGQRQVAGHEWRPDAAGAAAGRDQRHHGAAARLQSTVRQLIERRAGPKVPDFLSNVM